MMTGSDFARTFGPKGAAAWEAAAIKIAQDDGLTPWPFVPLTLRDDKGNVAVLEVMADDLAIGPVGDHLRLPLTPGAAQSILNLRGWLLPTPWIVYQMWRSAPVKLEPHPLPNKGVSMAQFAEHSAILDREIGDAPLDALRAGTKKSVVVSNIYQPGKVLIYGWFRPPPAPDVFDDRTPITNERRQPRQPKSNVHAANYWDYSHGIRAVGPVALVNGQPMPTVDLYQSPTLSHLVSNEGPVRTPRYPSPIPPAVNRPAHVLTFPTTPSVVMTQPSTTTRGIGTVKI